MERIGHMLRGNLSGTLLLYGASETARIWSEKLEEAGLSSRIGRSVGREPDDRCAFNLLTSAPFLSPQQMGLYKNIVLLDGPFGNAFVEGILHNAPGAVVLSLPMQKEAKQALKEASPDIERVRAMYRVLKSAARYLPGCNYIGALRNVISRTMPVSLPEMHIALCELRDMELIDFEETPFRVNLREVTGKKDFYTTQTYLWLQDKIQ